MPGRRGFRVASKARFALPERSWEVFLHSDDVLSRCVAPADARPRNVYWQTLIPMESGDGRVRIGRTTATAYFSAIGIDSNASFVFTSRRSCARLRLNLLVP